MELTAFLKEIPGSAYTVMTALITAIATLLGVYLTNKGNTHRFFRQLEHERESNRRKLMRDKLEELYVLSEKYINSLGCHYLPYLDVMMGELTYNQALDMTIRQRDTNSVDFHRLEMLIDLYFPENKAPYDLLLNARDRANEIMTEHKRQYKTGNMDGSRFVEPFLKVQDEITRAAKALREHIVSEVAKV
jgi:hypothetical protein